MLCIGTPNWISFDFVLCSCRVLALLIGMITSKGREHSHLFQSTLNRNSKTNGYDQKGLVTSRDRTLRKERGRKGKPNSFSKKDLDHHQKSLCSSNKRNTEDSGRDHLSLARDMGLEEEIVMRQQEEKRERGRYFHFVDRVVKKLSQGVRIKGYRPFPKDR